MTGVTPSGPGSRPTDEAASCTASSPEASIPNAVLLQALRLTESNLTSLINAKHSDAVLMTDWREVVRKALGCPQDHGFKLGEYDATPDLYEALHELMSCLGGDAETAACIKAERVLAKVRGEQVPA